ncbi:ATP-binding protein [Mycolicibacterium phlei]
MTADTPTYVDVSQRQLLRRAAMVGLLMRNGVNLLVAVVALVDPQSSARPAGMWLLGVTALWSSYRLLSRSRHAGFLAADYLLVIAVCLAIPLLTADPVFYASNTAPQAIAGTAVVSISVSVAARASLPLAVGVAIAYALGAGMVVGWDQLAAVSALYYFVVQWGTASVIRLMLLRVAGAVDRARADRLSAELNQRVAEAVRDYEREQLALLHDTAASTLLMVGQGAALPPQRLAAQARRDLDLLRSGPWVAPPPHVELVAALRQCADLSSTPVEVDGCEQLWLDGATGQAVVAAAREVMNNVDRHAHATLLTITVSDGHARLADNGIGFDVEHPRDGHGVTDSIIGRMRRAGGSARIQSAPGRGTVVDLYWGGATDNLEDPDRLIDRIRRRYALALTGYALVNLAFGIPNALRGYDGAAASIALGIVAAASVFAGRGRRAWFGIAALMVVTVVQPLLLPGDLVGGYAHWAQNAVGWCLIPLVLGWSTRAGTAVLVVNWTVGAAVEIAVNPSAAVLVNLGLGTGSILGVQLFALMFNGLMRDAAHEAQLDTAAHERLVTLARVRRAVREEYHRRYAKLVATIVPLLEALARNMPVDDALRRQACAECRRLRALFDQATTFDHPLMRRLRPLIDAAEARRVDVVVDLGSELPELDAADIEFIAEQLSRLLNLARTSARLVLTTSDGEINVSLVCDVASQSAVPVANSDDVEVIVCDETVWCLIRRFAQPALR